MIKKGYNDIKDQLAIRRTGKSFAEWQKILDRFNVQKNGHDASVQYLRKAHKANNWWSHVIVIRYEHDKKMRRA